MRQKAWQVFPLKMYPVKQVLHVVAVQEMQKLIPQLGVQRPVDGL
jgi:hypothetical protein